MGQMGMLFGSHHWRQPDRYGQRLGDSLGACSVIGCRRGGDLFLHLLLPPNCISRALTTPSTLSHKEAPPNPFPCRDRGAHFLPPSSYPATSDVGPVVLLSTISTPSLMSRYRRPWLRAAIEALVEGGHPPIAQTVGHDRSPSPSPAVAKVRSEGGDGSPSTIIAVIGSWQVARPSPNARRPGVATTP
jgi:hypothetical protein